MAPGGQDVHLVILIHGLWGSPAHLATAKEQLEAAWANSRSNTSSKITRIEGPAEDPVVITELKENSVQGNGDRYHGKGTYDDVHVDGDNQGKEQREGQADEELVVIIAGGMTSQLTYDGIDVCASRVAWEVDEQIARLEQQEKNVTRFSVTGYSLGGLVARYLVGLLHARTPSFFGKYQPVTFSTIATPHLGIPRYNTFLSTVLVWLGARLLSRSGEQLYVADQYSEDDPRPLLEIMADPKMVFMQALEQFNYIQVFANGVNDHTVPYPSSAIETFDHFSEWDERGLEVEADEYDIITSWRPSSRLHDDKQDEKKKKGWKFSMGTLPPVLRYRYPFNYIIMLLFPIMLPLIILLLVIRQSLDTRKSKRRLQILARTPVSPSIADDTSPPTPQSSIPSASGLSVHSLRDAIRRVERNIESDFIDNMDSPSPTFTISPSSPFNSFTSASSTPYQSAKINTTKTRSRSLLQSIDPGFVNANMTMSGTTPDNGANVRVRLKESQLRMAIWLNALPICKFVTWYPDVANSHAVAIVRDPKTFPLHNRGRGLLKRWAQGVLSQG